MDDDFELATLSEAQLAAMRHVDSLVDQREVAALRCVHELLARAGCAMGVFDEAMACVRGHARVVLHFHPDWVGSARATVAEALLRDGQYRNQFETGLSSGSSTAFPGGARDNWEKSLFAGAYHREGVSGRERPKYGALELPRFPDGPIPRFGSCHFVLRPSVTRRTSFTFMGSEDPLASERIGTVGRMRCVMAALLTEIENGAMTTPPWPPFAAPTLGVPNLTVTRMLDMLRFELPLSRETRRQPGRVLDTQIEAQVHGDLYLARDAELLVVDPAFEETPTGEHLLEFAHRYEVPLHWHTGFRLRVADVPDDFRGPAMPRLARRIAVDGVIDAAVIGAAARSLFWQPEAWQGWGTLDESRDHLKQLWHVLVHYGGPIRTI